MKILPRSSWTSAPNGRAGRPLSKSGVTAITLHYPASGRVRHAGESQERTAQRLAAWRRLHVAAPRSWADIGYNYAIDQAGRVWNLTGYNRGAHAGGSGVGNTTSVGVLLIVGDTEEPTPAMIRAIREFRDHVRADFPNARKVLPHSHWTRTGCPGDQVRELIESGRLDHDPAPAPATEPWFTAGFVNVQGDDSQGAKTYGKRIPKIVDDLATVRPDLVGVCELRPGQEPKLTGLMAELDLFLVRAIAGNALYAAKGTQVGYRGNYYLPDRVQGEGRREALLRARLKVNGHWLHAGVSHLDYRPGARFDQLRVDQALAIAAAMGRLGSRFELEARHRHIILMDDNSRAWVPDRAMTPAGYPPAHKSGLDGIYMGEHPTRPVLRRWTIATDSDHPIVAVRMGKVSK